MSASQLWLDVDWAEPASALPVVTEFLRSVRPRDGVQLAVPSGSLPEQEAGDRLVALLSGVPDFAALGHRLPDITVHEGALPAGAEVATVEGLRETRKELAQFVAVTPVMDRVDWAREWRPHPGFRHLVVDNASTDGTAEALVAAGAEVVVNPERIGRVPNWHAAMAAFRDRSGLPWMKWLFAGDELLPGAADVLADAVAAHPEARMVVAEYYIRFPDGRMHRWTQLPETRVVEPEESLERSAVKNWFGSPTGQSFHRDALGDVDFGLQNWPADWQAALLVAKRHPVLYVNEPVGVFDMPSRRYYQAKSERVDSLVQEMSLQLQSLEHLREIAPDRDVSRLELEIQAKAANQLSQRVAAHVSAAGWASAA